MDDQGFILFVVAPGIGSLKDHAGQGFDGFQRVKTGKNFLRLHAADLHRGIDGALRGHDHGFDAGAGIGRHTFCAWALAKIEPPANAVVTNNRLLRARRDMIMKTPDVRRSTFPAAITAAPHLRYASMTALLRPHHAWNTTVTTLSDRCATDYFLGDPHDAMAFCFCGHDLGFLSVGCTGGARSDDFDRRIAPGDVLEGDKRGLKIPVLRQLAAEGVYATGVRNVLPTVTYPDHTTLITGVWPARHGIAGNQTFDPQQQNMTGWYWYAHDIKVKTLWDAVHDAGGTVASLSWPVSVGAASINFDVPEYWRAKIPEDMKLVRALATPGLVDELEKDTGLTLAQADGETVQVDLGRARFAAALIQAKHPTFTTVHLRGLDHTEHAYGPGSPEANAVLEQLDAGIGALIETARKAEPDLVVAIVFRSRLCAGHP